MKFRTKGNNGRTIELLAIYTTQNMITAFVKQKLQETEEKIDGH